MKKINKRGFTLVEIVAVLTIFGVIMTVAIIAVTKYVDWARENTYNSYLHNIEIASKNNMIDCVSGKSECDIPESGYSKRLALDDLIDAGYSEKLRDPDKDGAFCSGYVLIENEGASVPDLKYKGCLKCSNYETAGCDFVKDDEANRPSDCDSIVGQSTEWTRNPRVIKYGCDVQGKNCKYKKTFSGTSITPLIETFEMKTVNGDTCPVNIYIDTTKPECELNMTGEIGQNNWYLEDVKVTLTPKIKTSREGAKVVDFGISTSTKKEYNGLGELTVTTGVTTVFGYVKDDLGNEGFCPPKEIKVDASKPEQNLMLGYQVYPETKNRIETDTSFLQISELEKYKSVKSVLVFLKNKATDVIPVTLDYYAPSVTTSGVRPSWTAELETYVSGRVGAYTEINNDLVEIVLPQTTTFSMIELSGLEVDEIDKVVMLVGNPNGLYTNKNMLVYNFASDSGTGINSYSFDGGATWQNEKYKWYALNSEVKAKVKDALGTESDEQAINIEYIDKILPTIKMDTYEYLNKTRGEKIRTDTNANVNITTWVNNNYIFDLSNSTDDASGIDYVEWGWNSGNKKELSTTITKDDTARSIDYDDFSLETDGARYAKFTVYDKAGNARELSATVYIDKVAPSAGTLTFKKNNSSGSVISNGSVVNTDVYVTKNNGSDTMSGHSSTKYTVKINGVVVDSNVTVNKTYSQEGEYELIVTTTDKAGHTSTRTYNFVIDKTAPTIKIDTYEYSNSTKVKKLRTDTNANVSITTWKSYGYAFDLSNSSDNYSGIDYVKWQWNYSNNSVLDKTIKDSADKPIDHEYTLTGNGVRYGVFTVYDKAGNSKSITVIVYIDTKAPTVKINAYKYSSSAPYYTGSVLSSATDGDISITSWKNYGYYLELSQSSDSVSGIKSVTVKWNAGGKNTLDKTIPTNNVTSKTINDYTTLTGEGVRYAEFTIVDNAGNSKTASVTVYIDKTAPSITIGTYKYLNKTKGEKIRSDKDVNVSITSWKNYNYIFDLSDSTDSASGIDYVEWGWNSGNKKELSTTIIKDSTNRAINYNDFSLETDGARYAEFKVYDKAGNSKTVSATVYIDKAAPTIKINAYKHSSSSPYYTGSVLASATDGNISITSWKNYGYYFDISGSSDSISGINSIKWQWNDSGKKDLVTTFPSGNSSEISSELYSTLTGNGARYGKFTITDKAGNTRSVSVTVYIDKTAPVAPTLTMTHSYNSSNAQGSKATVYTNNTVINKTVYMTDARSTPFTGASSSDSGGSGLKEVQISTDNKTWVTYSYDSTDSLYVLKDTGTYKRYFRALDNAGNVSSVVTKTIIIDKTAPSCPTITKTSGPEPKTWSNQNVVLQITPSSGTKSWDWYTNTNGGEYTKYYSGTTSSSQSMSGEGKRKGRIIVSDDVGNTRTCDTEEYWIDKTQPTIKIGLYAYNNSTKGSLLGTYTNENINRDWNLGGYYFDISGSSDNGEIKSITFEYNASGNGRENNTIPSANTTSKNLSSSTTLTGWGYRYAKFTFVDKAGNSRVVSIVVRISREDLVTLNKQGGTGGTDKLYQRYGIGYYDLNKKLLNQIDIPEKIGCTFTGYYNDVDPTAGSTVISGSGNFMNLWYNEADVGGSTWYASWAQKAILGDVNADGEINIKDVTLINKYLDPKIKAELTSCQLVAADVNGDGSVESYVLDTGNVIEACPNNRAYVCTYDDCMIQHYLSKGLAAMKCE